MANTDPADVGVDPLNAQFADLNMSALPAGGTTVHDTDPSSSWTAQDASFFYSAQTDFLAISQPQPQNDAAMDPHYVGYLQYTDHTGAQQEHWPPPSALDAQAAAYPSQAGPSSVAASSPEKPFKCDHTGCNNAYNRQCELEYVRPSFSLPPAWSLFPHSLPLALFPQHADTDPSPPNSLAIYLILTVISSLLQNSKHKNNHKRPRRCDICGKKKAERKDLHRHMWAHHPDEARRRGVPKDEDFCPECEYHGRKDNVKRHREIKGH